MRKIKTHGSYLKNQTRKNLAKSVICIIMFGAVFLPTTPRLLFYFDVGFCVEAGLLVSLVSMIGFYYYLRKYRIYRGGWEGEVRVAKLLNAKLSDDYYLINDVYFHDGNGDIDHIVLGPNGLFVIETKNWSGRITCNGDEWYRQNRHKKSDSASSPSRQVKRNAARVKNAIETSETLRPLRIWVDGIVVFTNNHADLHMNYPTIPILKLHELPNYITSYRSRNNYSSQQLQTIGKEILKQTH